ncbi:MAG: hypothetical protein ACLP8S_20090 [Solirubrobacteraceae bacterium]
MEAHLTNHHRNTLEKILAHPASTNIEWRQVLSLVRTIGTAAEEHNGKVTITLGGEIQMFEVPRSKDIDVQTIVDLRRMLRQAGFAPDERSPQSRA